MYVYEGEDYSKCSDEDKKSFDQLLAGSYSYTVYKLKLVLAGFTLGLISFLP